MIRESADESSRGRYADTTIGSYITTEFHISYRMQNRNVFTTRDDEFDRNMRSLKTKRLNPNISVQIFLFYMFFVQMDSHL